VAAVLAGTTTFGLVGASAATLGGITSDSLGADSGVVSSCDTDGVTVAFTNSYDAASGGYRTSSAQISGINAACNTKSLSLTLKDASGTSLGAGTVTVAAGAATVTLSPNADAESAVGAAIVISG
jgi:hypothetical protein